MAQNLVNQYSHLLNNIRLLLESNRQKVMREINRTVVVTYWEIGRHIVEFEQGGKERAAYGTELVKKLLHDHTQSFGKGYSYRNLQLAKKFYQTYPIMQSLIAQSQENTSHTSAESALVQASWTHLVRLLSVTDET